MNSPGCFRFHAFTPSKISLGTRIAHIMRTCQHIMRTFRHNPGKSVTCHMSLIGEGRSTSPRNRPLQSGAGGPRPALGRRGGGPGSPAAPACAAWYGGGVHRRYYLGGCLRWVSSSAKA